MHRTMSKWSKGVSLVNLYDDNIEVYWPHDKEFYQGRIADFNTHTGLPYACIAFNMEMPKQY